MGDAGTALFFRAIGWTGAWLPPIAEGLLADALGSVAYALGRSRREVVQSNMRRVLGPDAAESEVRRLTRKVFSNFYRSHMELGWARSVEPRRIAEHMVLHNEEQIIRIRESGRGILYLLCHLGNWELAGLGYGQVQPIHVVVWRLGQHMEKLLNPVRQRTGFRSLYTDDSQMLRKALSALMKREGVVIMADSMQAGGGEVEKTTTEGALFGQPWRFPRSPVFLADRTGAALVPAFVLRDDYRDLHIHFEEEIPLYRTEGGQIDERAIWREFAAHAEHHIRRRPEQWMWMTPPDRR